MTDDIHHEMRRHDLDRRTADRILGGHADASSQLEALFSALRASPKHDAAREHATVTAMAEIVRAHAGDPVELPVRPPLGLAAKAKIAAVATGVFLLGSSSLATAGALPDPAQSAAAEVLSRVGVTVERPMPPGLAKRDEVRGDDGASSSSDHSDKGDDVSSTARDDTLHGRDKGNAVSDTASQGRSRGRGAGARAGADTARGRDRGRGPRR